MLAALQATNTKLGDHTFLFQGAGEAALGIANLIAMALEKREGVPYQVDNRIIDFNLFTRYLQGYL